MVTTLDIQKTWGWSVWILILVSLLSLSGCKKSINKTPETIDPIYNDLLSEHARFIKEKDAAVTARDAAELKLKELAPRDPQTWVVKKEISSHNKKITTFEQFALFYKLRAEKRQLFARKSYLKAYNADQPWPDPAEFARYQAQKRLETASRNWGDRVPKAQSMFSKDRAPAAEKKAEAAPAH